MALLLWCVCGGFLLHFLESNYLTLLLKQNYEKPVDTPQDILDKGLEVLWPPGYDVISLERSPTSTMRALAERVFVPKVIFFCFKKSFNFFLLGLG